MIYQDWWQTRIAEDAERTGRKPADTMQSKVSSARRGTRIERIDNVIVVPDWKWGSKAGV